MYCVPIFSKAIRGQSPPEYSPVSDLLLDACWEAPSPLHHILQYKPVTVIQHCQYKHLNTGTKILNNRK